jgi:ribA/ribD-fused uncharacterized protein
MKKILYNEIGPKGKEYRKEDWKEFVVHNEEEIKGFFGPYRFLSNFWPARVTFDGVEYRSVELAYQAAKWSEEKRIFFLTCTELESIDHNRENPPDLYSEEEWDKKKVVVMRYLVYQKFDPNINPENYQMLIETGDKHLEEMNWWEDTFWGTDQNSNGENMLGEILMETRAKLVQVREKQS